MALVPDTALVRLLWDAGTGGIRICSLYFGNELGWTVTQGNALLDAAETSYTANLAAFAPDSTTAVTPLTQLTFQDLGSDTGVILERAVNIDGTSLNPMAPANCATVVNFLTDGQGAPRRGRIFWPYVEESAVGYAGLQTAAWISGTQTAVGQFAGDVAGAVSGTSHVVVSRFSKSAVPTPPHERDPAITKDVSGYVTRSLVGSQRDRRAGEGS